MHLEKDLREFVELLNALNVRYMVVGAFAVAYHGYPRFTADIDLFILELIFRRHGPLVSTAKSMA